MPHTIQAAQVHAIKGVCSQLQREWMLTTCASLRDHASQLLRGHCCCCLIALALPHINRSCSMQLLLDITRILLTVHGSCSVPDAVCALTGDSMRKQGLWGGRQASGV